MKSDDSARIVSTSLGAVSLDLFVSHTLAFLFSTDASGLLFSQRENSCSFEAIPSGYVILCLYSSVISQSLLRLWGTHTFPLYTRSMKSLFMCLTSNSLALKFPNHFIFNNLHLCFAAPSHSLGHSNVYCLMLIKTPTSGCSVCMLSLLSLISSVFPCLWEVSCGPSTVFQSKPSGSSTSWHGVSDPGDGIDHIPYFPFSLSWLFSLLYRS